MDNLKTRVALTRAAAGLAVAAMGVAGPLIGGAAASSTTSTPPGTTTSPLATSAAPKEVVIDPTTGSVQSVTPLSSAAYQALLAIANADSDNSASTSN